MPSGALDQVKLHLVDDLDTLDECRRWVSQTREGPLFFDTESAGLSPYRDRLRLGQIGDLTDGWAFPVEWVGAMSEILMKYQGDLGAHNHGYDNRVMQQWVPGFVPQWHKTEDSLTAGHLADSLKLAGLKERAEIEIDSRSARGQQAMQDGMRANKWTWATVPVRWAPYWTYGALDPVLAAHLWKLFGPLVKGRYRDAYDLERATIRICASMMDAGMRIDIPFINQKITEIHNFSDVALRWLNDTFGLTTVNSGPKVMGMLNQVGIPTEVFTDEGNPSISKEALRYYAAEYPEHAQLVRTVQLCRKAGDLTGKYLGKFLDLADGDTMHYSIWPCRARTSRMSVTDPPMQTYDRDEPVVRGAYIPREGYVFGSIDADQIEARMTAHFSGDRQMITDFHEADRLGKSFFLIMAAKIYKQELTKKDPRYSRTKNATYAQIYGSGLTNAAATAGVPVEQMRPVYYGTQELYPGISQLMNRLIKQGKYGGGRPHATAIDGRDLYVRRGHEYAILNTLVQGSAAVIMKRGLVNLDAAGFGPYMRLPVHDEILFEFPKNDAQAMLAEASRILTDRETLAVPLTWGGNILEERWAKT
jgi:DNA polymerase-1